MTAQERPNREHPDTPRSDPEQARPARHLPTAEFISLEQWLATNPPLATPAPQPPAVSIGTFLHLALGLANALHELHQQRITHRSINPACLFVKAPFTHTDSPAQVLILETEAATTAGAQHNAGQLAYSSPEQTGRMNQIIDHRTDLYSLGVVFYQLLIGRLPFAAADPLALVHAHIAAKPIAPVALRSETPQPISEIILKLLAKDAHDRYQSADGLASDLAICLTHWRATGAIEPFLLGQHDVPDRLLLPQGLYGREQELARLSQAFADTCDGVANLLLVLGESGVGKTSLVGKLMPSVVAKGGIFIAARAVHGDQQIGSYATVMAVVADFVQQLLTWDAGQIALWRDKLALALTGATAQVIRSIPELGPLLPTLPEADVESSDPKAILTLALQSLFRTLANPEYPLVVFVDDAQWADAESWQLLRSLTQTGERCLLVICAYRADDAVNGRVQEIVATIPPTQQLTLPPLDVRAIAPFLANALYSTAEQVNDLARVIYDKTGGNAFFVREFLHALHDKGLLSFDPQARVWRWDLAQIKTTPVTENVVDLVQSRLQQLPVYAQKTLKVAALMGAHFRLSQVAPACQQSLRVTAQALQLAMELNAVVPLTQNAYQRTRADLPLDPRLAAMEQIANELRTPDSQGELAPFLARRQLADATDEAVLAPTVAPQPVYEFAHDKIREAASLLLPVLTNDALHYQIGRGLMQSMTAAQRLEHCFLLVSHLNKAAGLLTDYAERVEVATLNLRAGRQALSLTAYENAFMLPVAGIALLMHDPLFDAWQRDAILLRDLHLTAAQAAARNGQFEECERLLTAVEQRFPSALDLAVTTQVRIFALYLQGKHEEALVAATRALRALGVRLPQQPRRRYVLVALARTRLALLKTGGVTPSKLPMMSNERSIKAIEIMAAASISAAAANPSLLMIIGMEIVRQTVQHGAHALSAMGYALYGVLLCGAVGEIDRGYAFGQLALRLLPEIKNKEWRAFVKYFVYAHIKHWKEPIKATLQPLRDLATTGEFEYLAVAAGLYPYFTWFIDGKPVADTERAIAENMYLLAPFKDTPLYYRYQFGQQYLQNLLGRCADPTQLVGEAYDEQQLLPVHLQGQDRATVFYVACHKLTLCVLFEDYVRAQNAAALALAYSDAGMGTPLIPVLYFYQSLAALGRHPTAPKAEARQILQTVRANQRKLKKWAQHGPANCRHRYTLIEAEQARVSGDHTRAKALYDAAIDQAEQYEYLPELALAHELAAKFYLALERPLYAEAHLAAARGHYQTVGALAKTDQIETHYQQFFSGRRFDQPTGFASLGAYLDMATILKASQVLSSETVLSRLTEKLTDLLVENAGAQYGYLLLPADNQWQVVAARMDDAARGDDAVSAETELGAPDQPTVALSIVRQAARTREALLINDVATATAYARDPHVLAAQPRSILCLPLLHNGVLVGVFYMENRLTRQAFPPERLQPLTMLATQAAISLQNASLVAGLEAAQVNIKASEARFRLLFENAPLGLFEIDIAESPPKIRAANRRAEAVYGWSAAELSALDPTSLIPNDSRSEIERLIEAVRAGKTAFLETTNRRRDGTDFPARIIATPASDQQGKLIVVAVEDVTAQQQSRTEAEAIDDERRRIAQEIHDGVAQDLAFLRLKLSLWRDWIVAEPERMHAELDETKQMLDVAIDEIRRSIYALRPVALDEVGLLPALRHYVGDFNHAYEIYVNLQIDIPEQRLPADLELLIFRVVQEALNNIAKHAHASLAWVHLARDPVPNTEDVITMSVRDNGQGFEMATLDEAGRLGHLGLKQMHERIEKAGGELRVASQPGQGATIQVRVPVA